MKKIIVGNVLSTVCLVIGITAFNAKAQPLPPQLPPPDISMLTNHASLVGYAFKQIKGIKMNVNSGAQVDNWQSAGFFEVTNEVKTLETLMDIVDPVYWGLRLADTKAFVNLNGQFWNTNDQNAINNNYYGQGPYVLFNAFGGGQPVKKPSGFWTLPDESTEMDIHLADTIRVKIKGLVDARIIENNGGGFYGDSMGGVSNEELYFRSDYAGTGEIFLTRQYQTADGSWFSDTRGYYLTNGLEGPITWVQLSVLLHDSDDFRSFKNQTVLDVSVFAIQGYGKVPLLMATYSNNTTNVLLNVHTLDGQYAMSYTIENQTTKVKRTVTVPAGATSVRTEFAAGVYYIVPNGINLQSANYPYYYGWYGKGSVPPEVTPAVPVPAVIGVPVTRSVLE